MGINNNFHFATIPSTACADLTIIGLIKTDTTREQFNQLFTKFPDYKIDEGYQALGMAVLKNNISLIEYIVDLVGKSLFQLTCHNACTLTPLHLASQDIENGYSIAKRLLQLGSPVNLILDPKYSKKKIYVKKTPLNLALEEGNIKVAALLLRHGGIPVFGKVIDAIQAKNLIEARKEIMTKNEMYFAQLWNQQNAPLDILNFIHSLGLKLELQT